MKINKDLTNVYVGSDAFKYKQDLWIRRSNNLFDGALEVGNILTENGHNYTNTSHCRSINFIIVEPSSQYTITITQEAQIVVYYYDITQKYISSENLNATTTLTFTTPANCHYIRFRFNKPALVGTNIMLNRGATSQSYEPFVTNQIYTKDKYTNYYNPFSDFLYWRLKLQEYFLVSNKSYGNFQDFNQFMTDNLPNGLYYVNGKIDNAPTTQSNGNWYVFWLRYNGTSTYATQFAVSVFGDGYLYTRTTGSGGWGAWKRIQFTTY